MKRSVLALAGLLLLVPVVLFANGGKDAAEAKDGPVELTFLTVGAVYIEDYETNEFTQFMEDKTGVHINWETIPEQAQEEKLNLILASGDYPDVFFGLGLNDNKLTQYGVDEELLLPLNGLIDDYMPNLQKVLEEVPGSKGSITSTNGKIYGLPSFNICFHCVNSNKMWVYKPWLDALGMEMPKTTDEFYAMLKAFRDKDPNGNGKKDEVPFAGATRSWHGTADLFLLNSFVYTDINSRIDVSPDRFVGFYVDNGKIKTDSDTPAFRDGLRYLHKLYDEGLLFPGSFTQTQEQLVQLVEGSDEPVVGVTVGGWGGIFSNFGGERYSQFRPLAPLAGPDGVQNTPSFLAEPQPGQFVLSTTCKNPEAAVKWADYLYSAEGTLNARNGKEGVGWKWAKEGDKGINGEPAIWTSLRPWNDTDPQNESFLEVGPRAQTNSFRLGQTAEQGVDLYGKDGIEQMLYKATKELYRPYAKDGQALPRLQYLPEEVSEYATTRVEYAKYLKQSMVQFIVGDLDLDSDWDAYVKNLKKLGQDDLLAITQKAYDRQFK